MLGERRRLRTTSGRSGCRCCQSAFRAVHWSSSDRIRWSYRHRNCQPAAGWRTDQKCPALCRAPRRVE